MDKQYILRKPIKTQFWDDEEDRIVDISIPNQCCNDGSHDETTLLLENFNDLFVEFDENAAQKQIEDALEDYANFKLWESRQDWKDDFDRKDNLAHEKKMHVDKLLAILGGI